MKQRLEQLIKGILWLLVMMTVFKVNAQSNDSLFIYTIANDVQTSEKVMEFDLYIRDANTDAPFELAATQAGILVNPAIYNGGTISISIVANSSELSTAQKPSSVVWSLSQNAIKLTPKSPPGAGSGTIISQTGLGTRVCRLRITNTVAFAPNTTANLTFNFTTSPYPTKVSYYISGVQTQLSCNTGNSTSSATNIALNPPPTIYAVTGGGSYCSGGSGVSVGLANSQSGVTYTLYKDAVAQTPTVAGTGSAISFGNQTAAGTYTVQGTSSFNITSSMSGSAVVSVDAPTAPTVNVVNNCGSSALTASDFTGSLTWSTLETATSINVSVAGSYTVTQNINGCTSPAGSGIAAPKAIPDAPGGSSAQWYCANTSPEVIDLLATGTAVQWYAVSSNGTALSSSSALGNNTHYYASQTIDGCESTARLDVTVTLHADGVFTGALSTQWNNAGNWCGGIPTVTSDVIIPSGTVHVTSTGGTLISCNNLTVNSGASLIVDAGKFLTVAGLTTVNGTDGIIIKSDGTGTGSFIDNGFAGSGSVKVEKYLAAANTYGWGVASPVDASGTGVFAGSLGVYFYNPMTPGWQSYSSGNMSTMGGYMTKFGSNKTLEFSGNQLNTSTQVFNNFYRTGFVSGNFGWNYMGNPYPSAINWDNVVNINGGYTDTAFIATTKLNNAIYISDNNGGFNTYVNGIGTNGFNGVIPPATAFWVQVNRYHVNTAGPLPDAHLTLNNSVRVHEAQMTKEALPQIQLVSLKLQNQNYSDEVIVGLKEGATTLFEPQYEAVKMFSENDAYPQLYSVLSSHEKLSINCISDNITQPVTVPLGFTDKSNSLLNISANDLSSVDMNISIYLEDKTENKIIDLRQQQTYFFSTTVNENNDRFMLHFRPATAGITTNNEVSGPSVYVCGSVLYISNIEEPTQCVIYNMLGQEVERRELAQDTMQKTDLNLPAGAYVVSLISKEQTVNQKVFVK